MSQTKFMSIFETCTNTFIGYMVAVCSQIIIFPLFNIQIPLADNFLIGLWFTFISILRGYFLRRLFNKFEVFKHNA
ncbi:hypothetical protein UFOVP1309_73 [uncultured Caudovirales phage]|uniref:Uncharacterized protein n=1 Tax=uncultured Caudovirales phage TaxID=2100421 RepID=A0A6J5RMU2_9CAUD|nr:hypothetical protein UFOVP1309_73 [uncultured Caudovirales phage]